LQATGDSKPAPSGSRVGGWRFGKPVVFGYNDASQ
jgi:hypothetical protein